MSNKNRGLKQDCDFINKSVIRYLSVCLRELALIAYKDLLFVIICMEQVHKYGLTTLALSPLHYFFPI